MPSLGVSASPLEPKWDLEPLTRPESPRPCGPRSPRTSLRSSRTSFSRSPRTSWASSRGLSPRHSTATASSSASSRSRRSNLSSASLSVHSAFSAPASARLTRPETISEVASKASAPAPLRAWSKRAVDSKLLTAVSAVLTVYALTGDDCRLIFTDKPMDPFFDFAVLVCFAVFSFELVVSVFAKADYLWSFFFWLDAVSTLTLLIDLSVVTAWFFQQGQDDDDNAKDMRSGRTAKMGAKAGRVVRVVRLTRILKLYRAMLEVRRQATRRRSSKTRVSLPGVEEEDEEDWDPADFEAADARRGGEAEGVRRESQVGRRLSEVTTQRTICLVLAMLLVLPQLQAEVADQTPLSTEFGADLADQALREALGSPSARPAFERALLQYVLYHNWFARASPERFCDGEEACPAVYYGHVFWVGVMGATRTMVESVAKSAQLDDVAVSRWAGSYRSDSLFNYGSLPEEARHVLASPWSIECDSKRFKSRGFSLLAREIPGVTGHPVRCPHELRPTETMKFAPRMLNDTSYADWHLAFYFDVRPFVRTESVFGLLGTCAVLLLLLAGAVMFTHDANRLVVTPVEKMIATVQEIRNNPISAMNMALEEFKQEQVQLAQRMRKQSSLSSVFHEVCRPSEALMETAILEKSIIKLGSLLALGFGEAGANIISHNLRGDGSVVDTMVPGRCVDCVIGVARLRDFTLFIEVLQSKIMQFVNHVAEIVHGVVTEYHGAPNKNNGDAFLVVWRFGEDLEYEGVQRLVELSVVAFAKILGAVHRSPVLAAYRRHPGLQVRLGADPRVNLGFGLHAGWAIEGAVGSEYKIDASYLSPNVSTATSMEEATRLYGVPLVASQTVVELCTQDMLRKFRLIDHVIIRGARHSMELFCLDLDYGSVPVESVAALGIVWSHRHAFKARQFLESEKAQKLQDHFDVTDAFERDASIAAMRRRYTSEFFQLFKMGYQNYAQGEWQVARRILSRTRALLGAEDGPSSALLRFMEAEHRFEAPPGWRGVRGLGGSAAP